mgnify:FL=1
MEYKKLTPEEERVIVNKGTEHPFTGKYVDFKENGYYTCKRCGALLYRSADKLDSRCGWPSFDDEIEGAVKRVPDVDGMRTEIICNNCGAHLGHVFLNEGFTDKNTRHCVNSISLDFIPANEVNKSTDRNAAKSIEQKLEKAYFASGCFWGTQYHFERLKGVVSTTVGYEGGTKDKPTYEEVSSGLTGHAETTEVIYDPSKVSYDELVKLFFETHDFTQVNRQGPDIGTQYRSVIFYNNDEQKRIAEKYRNELNAKGYLVATSIEPSKTFWKAENYHQKYYDKKGGVPYCHVYRKIF